MKRNPEEAKHNRLLMLDEFDGEVDGELKFHKCLYQYREFSEEVDESEWTFIREERGPTDRGFSSVLQSYEDLELAEEDDTDNRRDFRLLSKGERVTKGIRRGLSKLDDSFEKRLSVLSSVAETNKQRSGSEITEDDSIQEAKEETYQKEL